MNERNKTNFEALSQYLSKETLDNIEKLSGSKESVTQKEK